MALRILLLSLLTTLFVSCGPDRDSTGDGAAKTEEGSTITTEEIELDAPLVDLSRPRAAPADPNPLNAYLAEVLETLMVKGQDGVDTEEITRRLLELMDAEQLFSRGRPEGVVRDKVVRIKEDMESYRPPRSLGKELSERQRTNLRVLGKLYAEDLRKKFSPEGADPTVHEGFLRQVPAIPADQLDAGHEALSWKQIGGFVFDKEKKILPEEILALNDRKVAIAGFLMPVAEFDQIHEFLLVDSLWTCCFGEAPAVNQVVIVKIPKDEPGVPYYRDAIVVHGRFDVGVEESEGWVTSVYRLEADSVRTIRSK